MLCLPSPHLAVYPPYCPPACPSNQVAVVEAMKMRNVLRAEVAGVVAAVEAGQGEVLGADQVIVRLQ